MTVDAVASATRFRASPSRRPPSPWSRPPLPRPPSPAPATATALGGATEPDGTLKAVAVNRAKSVLGSVGRV